MGKKRLAVVTGASSGIGRAIAVRFARAGIRVAMVARRISRLEEIKSAIGKDGGEACVYGADLCRADEIAGLFGKIRKECGDPDILVNNAGIGTYGPLAESKVEDFDRVFNLNVRALYLATREVVPAMVRNRSGSIINIASIAGKMGIANVSIYCASKFAVMGLTVSLLEELRDKNIRVSAICPGLVNTEFFDKGGVEGDRKKFIQPEDVAEAAYLCINEDNAATLSEIVIRPRTPVT